jgi:hypothetical protein
MKRFVLFGTCFLVLAFMVPGTWAKDERDKVDFRNTVRIHKQLDIESGADVFHYMPRIALTWTTGSGFVIPDKPEYAIYTFDVSGSATIMAESDNIQVGIAGAGVTIEIPTPERRNDNLIFGVQNASSSGTTDGVLYVEGGLPIDSLSSTTRSGKDLDLIGDVVWIQIAFESTCSAFVINEMIH